MGLIDRLSFSPEQGAVLDRIARALERIADHLEGKTPPEILPEPAPDRLQVAVRDATEIDRFWRAEEELRQVLGRDPDADEIATLVDGVEWTAEDADARLHAQALRAGR